MSLLSKLNKVLENQIDILNSADLTGDELEDEIRRVRAITDVSKNIIAVNRLALDATNIDLEYGGGSVDRGLMAVSDDQAAKAVEYGER